MDRSNAAIQSSTIVYARRRPEKTALYQAVNQHMNTAFHNMEASGKYLPGHVRDEFESFLDCGILSKGFLRLSCSDCKTEKLVAFSCKKRGVCPSCGGRRMCDTAAHLVDNIFPKVPVRQWVISFPFNLRYIFAYNKKALSRALAVSIRAIDRYYKKRGKNFGLVNSKTGSVTLIQRFGGSLNLNIHFHILYTDGVWDESGKFYLTGQPKNEDIQDVVSKLRTRVFRALEKMGLIDGYQVDDNDEFALEFPGMAESISSSIQRKNSEGRKIKEIGKHFNTRWAPKEGKLCSYKDGFSLHAKVCISASDRFSLEHLSRYISRPAISNNRLSLCDNGDILYELKRPYDNGTTHLQFTPTEFMEKLIAIVPPPRLNLTRYHGVLGPHSGLRKRVVVKNKKSKKTKDKVKHRISWAKLIKRVFDFEVDKCRCGGKLRVVAAILNESIAVKIMESLTIEVYYPDPHPPRSSPLPLSFA